METFIGTAILKPIGIATIVIDSQFPLPDSTNIHYWYEYYLIPHSPDGKMSWHPVQTPSSINYNTVVAGMSQTQNINRTTFAGTY